MLWQYLRASYFFRTAVWVAFWSLLPGTLGLTTYFQVHRRLQGYYPMRAKVIERVYVGSELEPCVRIEYRDNYGRTQHADLSMSRPEEHALRPGNEVEVYVSKVKPTDAWFATHGEPAYRRVQIAAGFTMLFFAPLLLATFRIARRISVLRHGTLTAGQIEKVVRAKPSHLRSPYDYVVLYNYATTAGTSYQRRSARIPRTLADRWRKREHIPVFFDPGRPERAEADVYGFRNQDS